MTRRHSGSSEAFNADPNTGRMGFRYEWEPVDDRPLIVEYACQCRGCRQFQGRWRDRLEQATFEAAVAGNPRREGEGPMAYARRIAELVTNEREAGAKTMPRPRMSRAARDLRLSLLRGQAMGDGTVGEP